MSKIAAAVIGASGYTGLELIKILVAHPNFEIKFLGTSEGGQGISTLHPSLERVISRDVSKSDIDTIAACADLVFLAVPHKQAATFVKPLLERSKKVVDLSADYRLKRETYEQFYGDHTDHENLSNAVYGLPELFRAQIESAQLIANPGCYPTASLLAILPFLEYINTDQPIIIDAKSGVSGAGRACIDRTHFVNVSDNHFAYSPITHRHAPEINEKLNAALNKSCEIVFVPQMLPLTRGMLASVYIQLNRAITDPLAIARAYYADNFFVRVRENPVHIKSVAGTHFCDIFAQTQGSTLYVSSAIDNLLRGAASSAVANANLMYGVDHAAGLPVIAYAP